MQKPFFVWLKKKLRRIDPEEVMALVTEGNYTKIFLSDQTHCMVRTTLTAALKKLPPDMFIRTHRSCAVSIFYINNIEKDCLTIGEHPIPIAKRYYKSVFEQLNIIE
ncbi:LytR/AlgR family response regulator transcription factor [Paraflavitalea pollutisoli]|uniref:LytR/AlgR family response regulator transcription factor n=1 Tax=Paraflavitalea pollutisoli TaxID=3034143 RepID=UPI0023EACCB8|nr:LytTR family DNA-binding domain-containing protein [Paraflavitalea sp. H1-2-19X]